MLQESQVNREVMFVVPCRLRVDGAIWYTSALGLGAWKQEQDFGM